jgi:RNA polymerase sigma factor (sigma-70 family)
VTRPTFEPHPRSYLLSVEHADPVVELARRVVAGERGALDELLGELAPLVVRTARLIVGAGSWAAEDAAQEALLDVARGIATLREPEAVRAWALRVATTRALKVARSEQLRSLTQGRLIEPDLAAEPADARAAALKEAFDRLPPRLRATAVLRLHVGLTEAETAEVLECAVGTVKSNLHDARAQLAASLSEGGHGPVVAAKRLEETA